MNKGVLAVIILLVLAGGAFAALKLGPRQSGKTKILPTPETNVSLTPTESSTVPLPVSEALINEQLKSYLPRILQPSYNGKVFCAHHLYGFDEDKSTNMVKAYVWAYCEEYYLKDGQIKMGSGVSEPLLVTLELQNGVLGVQGHNEPGNGSLYAPSIREMFPATYAQQAINGYDIDKLSPSPKEQAEKFYLQ